MKKILLPLFLVLFTSCYGQKVQLGETVIKSSFSKEATPLAKAKEFFTKFNAHQMHLVGEFYAPGAIFVDPLGEHKGVASIEKYYQGLYQHVTSIAFDFPQGIEKDRVVFLSWKMSLKASLYPEEGIIVPGVSEFIFDENNLVIYQRDHFDAGAFVYEHVPIIGRVIKFIKRKMREQ
jgi:hypothetical protein